MRKRPASSVPGVKPASRDGNPFAGVSWLDQSDEGAPVSVGSFRERGSDMARAES